ncbi:MAG TPA: chromophore lyase CpcT/CpeT [Candidatus Polarisedimenticolaceae bacterium]|nr:chromophore lyase CpcT/CpeT [Candidatus Polarisedimenticolaceae bacterium]
MRRAFASTLLLAFALSAAAPGFASRDGDWESLARWLAGRFSSEAQSRYDPDYFEVRCDGFPLWKERGERWLYVERTVPGLPESPYRQTVYRLGGDAAGKDKRRFELAAYVIVEPGRFAGASSDPSRLSAMTSEDLVPRPGCSIVLERGGGDTFTGGTRGRDCPGDAPGVAYMTSEWTVTKDTLTRWDRGFDADGRQVWGATKGPYVFRRVEEAP